MDDATFNNMLQQFTDSGSAGHDPLRDWTAGLDDALKALPVVVNSQAASAAPMAAVPNPSAMGAQAAIQQYATVSTTTTMLQPAMTAPVLPPFGYDWAGQIPLDMYAGQATTAVYTTADAWNLPFGNPSFNAPPRALQSATFHDTAAVVQPPPPPPPPAVTYGYAALADADQPTDSAAASYVGPVVVAGAENGTGSLPAPSLAQKTSAQRNSATPSAPPQDGARTKYRPIAPKPPPPSVAAPSPSTAPSPVPHAPGTPLFPVQAPRLVLAPYSGILRGPPPSELLDEAPMAVSLAMLAQPASAHNKSALPMAPHAKQAGQPTKKARKLAAASTRRAQAAPAAVPYVMPVQLEKLAAPGSPGPRSNAVEVQAAPTARPLNRNAAPELAPSMQAPVPHDDAGPAVVAQGEEPTSEVAGAAPGQVVGQDRRHNDSAARRAKPAVQRKRGRPDVSSEIHSTKRPVTDELWQMRSLDSEESGLPVGHRVQSGNNLVSPQHSHTLQRSSPSPPQGTRPRASAGPSSGTPAASGSCPLTSTGAAQGSGAAAGPSGHEGEATDDEEDAISRKKGGKKKKKTKRVVDKSTNALGSLQAGLKWYSWMAPN